MGNVRQEFEIGLVEGDLNMEDLTRLKKYIFTMTDDEIKLFYDDVN